MDENKIKDILLTMIEWNLLDPRRLYDTSYVKERLEIYLESRRFVLENFKGMF
jgi:hypothetical protein